MNEERLLKDALALCREGKWGVAHTIVQQDDSRLAAWLHGVIHQEEGDLSNADYWFNRAGRCDPDPATVSELNHFEQELMRSNLEQL